MSNVATAHQSTALALPTRLPYPIQAYEHFGIERASWKALVEVAFPLATTVESVMMVLAYCKARNLDPLKKVVHIVPVYSKAANGMIDTVWPGIAELRTTAFRTKLYAGRDETEFGPDITRDLGGVEVTFPEWARVTVYRLVEGERCKFVGPKVWWLETYATAGRNSMAPNDMWKKRGRGQIDKCAEGASLRAAFPEELGGEMTAEEMQGQTIDGGAVYSQPTTARPTRDQYVGATAAQDVDPETGEVAEEDEFDAPLFIEGVKKEVTAATTLDALNDAMRRNAADIKRLTDDEREDLKAFVTEARAKLTPPVEEGPSAQEAAMLDLGDDFLRKIKAATTLDELTTIGSDPYFLKAAGHVEELEPAMATKRAELSK